MLVFLKIDAPHDTTIVRLRFDTDLLGFKAITIKPENETTLCIADPQQPDRSLIVVSPYLQSWSTFQQDGMVTLELCLQGEGIFMLGSGGGEDMPSFEAVLAEWEREIYSVARPLVNLQNSKVVI